MTIAPHPLRVVHAVVYGDGDWWTIELPELTAPTPDRRGTITATGQARTFDGVEAAAIDLAAAWLDVDDSVLAVQVDVRSAYPEA